MKRLVLVVVAAICAACVLGGSAWARSSADLAFDGGTLPERAQVRSALAASSFDWSRIGSQVTVHIQRGIDSHAEPGQVWLDADLVDSGRFGWAVVQDELAHEVDFLRLSADARTQLDAALGTQVWCHADAPGLPHSAYGCERFTSMLVWAYWQSPDNAYRPQGARRGRLDRPGALPRARRRPAGVLALPGGAAAGEHRRAA